MLKNVNSNLVNVDRYNTHKQRLPEVFPNSEEF